VGPPFLLYDLSDQASFFRRHICALCRSLVFSPLSTPTICARRGPASPSSLFALSPFPASTMYSFFRFFLFVTLPPTRATDTPCLLAGLLVDPLPIAHWIGTAPLPPLLSKRTGPEFDALSSPPHVTSCTSTKLVRVLLIRFPLRAMSKLSVCFPALTRVLSFVFLIFPFPVHDRPVPPSRTCGCRVYISLFFFSPPPPWGCCSNRFFTVRGTTLRFFSFSQKRTRGFF